MDNPQGVGAVAAREPNEVMVVASSTEDPEMEPQDTVMEVKKVKIRDMTWDDKKKALKEFWDNVWNDYKEGDFIDAMDTV
jgi:hypothetical protein